MIQKVYKVDPLVCPKCGEMMRIISVITDRQIMEHLKRNNAPPFDVEYTQAS